MIIAWQAKVPSHLPGTAEVDGVVTGDFGPGGDVIKQCFAFVKRAVAVIAESYPASTVDCQIRQAIGVGTPCDVQAGDADGVRKLCVLILGRDGDSITRKAEADIG